MKKSILKKALSLMLVAVLTLSLSGITVFAENAAEDESAAIITELPAETPGDTQAPETPEASEDPSAPPAAEPTVEPTAEPEQPLPTELPQISLSEYAINGKASDGAVITISGLLPVGAYVTAEPVAVTLGGGIVLAAYDIKIFDGEGSEWQPGESVSVSIDSPAIANADKVTIYHMEDTGAPAEQVATVNVAGTEVAFEAESFSIYAVVSGKYFKDSYTTYVGDTVILENYGPGNGFQYAGDWSITNGNDDIIAFAAGADTTDVGNVAIKALKAGSATIECNYKYGLLTLTNTFAVTVIDSGYGYNGSVSHINIRIKNANLQIKNIVEDQNGNVISTSTQDIMGSISGVASATLTRISGKPVTISNFTKFSDYEYYSPPFSGIELFNLAGVSAVVDISYTEGGITKTLEDVNIAFTAADIKSAIENCDMFSPLLRLPIGLDFIINSKTLTTTQTITTGTVTAPTTSVTVNKQWQGAAPTGGYPAVSVQLQAGGVDVAGKSEVLNGSTLSTTWSGLPVGSDYAVREIGYTPTSNTTTSSGVAVEFTRTQPCNSTVLPFNGNYIVAFKGNSFLVWTYSPLDEAQKTAFIAGFAAAATEANFQNINKPEKTIEFVSGYPCTYTKDSKKTTIQDGSIQFSDKSVWSQIAFGTYGFTQTITLVNTWVPTYSVTYKAGAGSGADVDGGSRAAGISYPVLSVLPGGFIAPVNHHFTGWALEAGSASAATSGSATQPAGNVVYVAQYAADPTYGVTYEYVADSGSLPSEISTTAEPFAVSDTDTYYVGQTVHNKYSGSTTYTVSTGVWTLISWSSTPTDAVMTSGGVKFTGTWAFTPNGDSTVTVHYVDTKGNTIADPKTVTGTIGSNYDVSGTEYVPTELVNAGIYYDYSSDKAGSALYTSAYAAAAAIITRVYAERTYFAPHGTKIVSGLSTLPTDYRVTLELRGPNGTAIATAILKAEDFEKQENGTFTASFGFGAPAGEGPVTFAPESLSLPAGTYAVVETSISSVSGMNLAAPAYSLTIFDGEEIPAPTATNQIPIGVNGENPEYRFTVTNAYSAIYYPPVDPTPGPTPTPPVEIPEEETPLTPTPPVEIPEEEVPLNPAPEEESAVEIVEEETPLAPAPAADKTIPQTGDNSATALFAILAVLSATGLAVLGFGGKKKERDSN